MTLRNVHINWNSFFFFFLINLIVKGFSVETEHQPTLRSAHWDKLDYRVAEGADVSLEASCLPMWSFPGVPSVCRQRSASVPHGTVDAVPRALCASAHSGGAHASGRRTVANRTNQCLQRLSCPAHGSGFVA